ncbi:MAG: hypothetical protein LBL13_05390 [Bacteroidales bacterium]|jgi:hypothetical protein|nr:hypothetical protein [Bacteroidales bacterium]
MKASTFLLVLFLWVSTLSLLSQEKENNDVIGYSNITEAGIITLSPQGVAVEGVSINGISINKQHNIGIGVGYGGSFHQSYYSATAYTPIFLNYRFYFKPDNKFSPHINLAAGGLLTKDGGGIYSSFTAGFRAGKFSFSSGISFMAIYREEEATFIGYYYPEYYPYFSNNSYSYTKTMSQWYFPFGMTVKCGFSL